MAKPTLFPDWDTTEANMAEPSSGLKSAGYATNDVPASNHYNWMLRQIGKWVRYLDGLAGEAITWTAAHIFQAGISVTTSGSNHAVQGTGSGAGCGVVGVPAVGGSGHGVWGKGAAGSALTGVRGEGGGNGTGAGGHFSGSGGTGSGKGVIANGTGSEPGVDATGGSTAGVGVKGTGGANASGLEGYGGSGGVGVYGVGGSNSNGGAFQGTGSGGGVSGAGASGAGVTGSASSGYGVVAIGNATRAALRVTPSGTEPSTKQAGDLWFDTDEQLLKVYVAGSVNDWQALNDGPPPG